MSEREREILCSLSGSKTTAALIFHWSCAKTVQSSPESETLSERQSRERPGPLFELKYCLRAQSSFGPKAETAAGEVRGAREVNDSTTKSVV
jgi:hypothetical protein